MRFEISILALGALAVALLAVAGFQGYGVTLDELPLHLMLSLPAAMAAALPHVWVIVYLLGTRRALAQEPAAADDLPAVRSLGRRAIGAAAVALAAIVALTVTGARSYTAHDGPVAHAVLFWALLAVQPAALAIEWRMLSRNHRVLARHEG